MVEYLGFIFSDPSIYARFGLGVALTSISAHSLLRAYSILIKREDK